MSTVCGLIPAAGRGMRAHPYTKRYPKCMLEIDGRPNLLRNIQLMRDAMNISNIFIVVGHYSEVIKDYFGDGSHLNVKLSYIDNDCLKKGLAYSVLLGKRYINDHFCVLLGDECYVDSNHQRLLATDFRNALVTLGVMEVDNRDLIRENYSVQINNGRIVKITEKPKHVSNELLGTGTFIFSPNIFDCIERSFNISMNAEVDLITLIDELGNTGEIIKYFKIRGGYANINDRDSFELAKYEVRTRKFSEYKISLLIYSEGNEEDIVFTVKEYIKSKELSDISVVVPHKNVVEENLKKLGVRIIKCPEGLDLYGERIKYALDIIGGDILVLTEASYSFPRQDLSKVLLYINEGDMVLGTRTTRQLIRQRSHMRGMVRVSNVILAKLLQVFWCGLGCRFTDVGCTLRALWRCSYEGIKEHLDSAGPEFSVEMTVELLKRRGRVIEVPVNYYGRSYALYRRYRNPKTFLKMLYVIVSKSVIHYVRFWRTI